MEDGSDVHDLAVHHGSSFALAEDPRNIDLTPELRSTLFDLGSWDKLLALFARTAKVAVALIDTDGRLLGKCHNPHPVWSLARAAKPVFPGKCLFCLETCSGCVAASEAARTRSITLAHDQGGFVHAAVPLTLGDRLVGMLLAGQILDGYPRVLPLQRIARDFGLSQQQVWDLARRQAPMSLAHLTVFAELLSELGQTFLRDCYGSFLERQWTAKAILSNRELVTVNSALTRKIAELDQSMREKEILLQEVHHRVKNNLQVVSGLLSLQMDEESDLLVSARLRVAYERIHSLSLVHEQIYRSKTLADLDLGEYVESLATHLYQSYCPDRNRIRMEVKTEPMRLVIDQAIPCGLILNELISNALKHAFTGGRNGLLEIGFRTTADHGAELVVADDGTGIPAEFDLRSAKSMGMQVVAMLIRQMEARLDISREGGTRFVLSWTVANTQPSVTKRRN